MSKYVDTDKLLAAMADTDMLTKAEFEEWIIGSTENVVPVIYGEWVTDVNGYDIVCSECKYNATQFMQKNYSVDFKYCPNCGAKMEGYEIEE